MLYSLGGEAIYPNSFGLTWLLYTSNSLNFVGSFFSHSFVLFLKKRQHNAKPNERTRMDGTACRFFHSATICICPR